MKLRMLIFPLLLLSILSSCKTKHVESYWSNSISIDGKLSDWDKFVYLDDVKSAVAVANNDSFLYVAFKTNDKTVAKKIVMNGLTVWLKAKGLKSPKYGIKYPIKPEADFRNLNNKVFAPPYRINRRTNSPPDISNLINIVQKQQTGFEVYGPGKDDIVILGFNNREGIRVSIGIYKGQFAYELKFPIFYDPDESHYSLSVKQKDIVTLKLESKPELPEQQNRPRFGSPSGGLPPRQGARGGQQGSMPGIERGGNMPRMNSLTQGFSLKIKVELEEHH